MGLNPQLAIMMSGIATIIFLLIVQAGCRLPRYQRLVRRWWWRPSGPRAATVPRDRRHPGAGLVLAIVGC